MVSKPPLPDDYQPPTEVNGWVHDPDSKRNGHVWSARNREASVGVFCYPTGRLAVSVFDDRVDGFCNKVEPVSRELDEDDDTEQGVVWAIDEAVSWMQNHAPEEWEHPAVEEAVFDPPVGYVLDRYYLEQRNQTVYYRREDAESDVRMGPAKDDGTVPTLETRAYLVVRTWRGSGNSTISVAPWLRAHDKDMHEVVDPPAGCGLEIAITLARQYVREETDRERESLATGQAGLGEWER